MCNLPTPKQVLQNHKVPVPEWLMQEPHLQMLAHFLDSRMVFYPGSGIDGHAFRLFVGSHSTCCIAHADYGVTIDDVSDYLDPSHPRHPIGYEPVFQEQMHGHELAQSIGIAWDHPFGQEVNFGGGLFAVLQRTNGFDETHGPERIAFLHLCAEAIWVYWQLWFTRHLAPWGMILQDHGYGSNWTSFGADGHLYQLARQPDQLPSFLLVGKNTDAWPGFDAVSGFDDPSGQHGHERQLFAPSQS